MDKFALSQVEKQTLKSSLSKSRKATDHLLNAILTKKQRKQQRQQTVFHLYICEELYHNDKTIIKDGRILEHLK